MIFEHILRFQIKALFQLKISLKTLNLLNQLKASFQQNNQ